MSDIAFPWWGESNRPRRRYRLDWFDFLSAYARVQMRFDRRMQELREAEARDAA